MGYDGDEYYYGYTIAGKSFGIDYFRNSILVL